MLDPLQTLRKGSPEIKEQLGEPNSANLPDAEEHNNIEYPNGLLGTQDQQEPPSSTLYTRPVLLTVAAYGTLSFLEMSNRIFLPLVYTTSIRLGGLGLSPELMGVCMAVWGIISGILQLTAFHRILKSLGLRRTFITLFSCLVPSFLLFPINGTHAQNTGTDVVFWALVLVQMLCSTGVIMSYGKQRPRFMRGEDSLNVSRRPFQVVPSYTSHPRLQAVCSARQTVSPRRSHPYSVPSRRLLRPHCSPSRWRKMSWAVTECSTQ